MLSGTDSQAENKKAALEQLRFRKRGLSNNPEASSSSSSTLAVNPPSQRHYLPPPAQSRDATIASRFFAPSTPSSTGRVLVPSSSPLTSELPSQVNPPHGYSNMQELAAHSAQPGGQRPYVPPWAQGRNPFGMDSLSAPTTFTSSNSNNNANLRRQRVGEPSHLQDDAPPRKKQNRGSSQVASEMEPPSSPEIQRAGTRRRNVNDSMDMSLSEDDSLPDISSVMSGPSRSRLVRERPSQPPVVAGTPSTPFDSRYQIFKMGYPGDSEARIKAAWTRAGGDQNKAAAILADPTWTPPSTSKITAEKDVGRVKEIDEATRAHRAAEREKGKKSMIYANRPILETNVSSTATPPTSRAAAVAADVVPSPASPSTPFVPAARKKRVRKLVYHSDSEAEASESDDDSTKKPKQGNPYELRALNYFNTRDSAALQELTGCTLDQADVIISHRPFESKEDFFEKLGQGKKKAGPAGLSPKIFDDSAEIFRGYGSVDSILEDCERIGTSLRTTIEAWTIPGEKASSKSEPQVTEMEDGALSIRSLAKAKGDKSKTFLTKQPSLLPDNIELKEYQLLGVNWLNLLYRRRYSCILADEMGLGKTIQVISFLAHLKEHGNKGPHLIVVPSSTLENWCREFARFAPAIGVQTYYAGKEERPVLRQTLLETIRSKAKTGEGWEVLITTYNLAQGDDRDRKFFRKIDWDTSIFDEGHVLKNFQSQRYQSLLKFGSNWRLLLTGTPLQNNLQELVSLMNFILPDQFAGQFESLQAIFKAKGDANVSLLSRERISRAKKMMTPFVLRRRKDQVLKDLPKKSERIEWCEMTELQKSIYTDALQRSRKTILEAELLETSQSGTPGANGKPAVKKKTRPKDKVYAENSSNVLMDLRKAASHPMLFRRQFTDDNLSGITRQLLKEPDFRKRGALFDIVKEDMTVMTDAELQLFCATYKSTRKFLKDESIYLEAGKVRILLKLLVQYRKEGRKILIFSQFTQILDILQAVLTKKNIRFLLLTGSTPVDVRQTLVDEFTEDDDIPVFLLSTKAGGMGINLTAASVVVMFDQDFNPHNDKQAQDRAYRIGQKRDVEVVKLISRGTIEEDMLRLGETKLALDEAVAGDTEGKGESAPEKEMKTSLMKVLRRQLEQEEQEKEAESTAVNE